MNQIRKMSELSKRILVAVIGIPITLAVVYIGGFVFFFAIILLSNLVLWEFFNLGERKAINPFSYFGMIYSSFLLTTYYLLQQNSLNIDKFTALILFIILIATLPPLFLVVQIWNKSQNTTISTAYTLLGIYWVAFAFLSLLSIRFLPDYYQLLAYIGNIPQNSQIIYQRTILDKYWSTKFFIAILGTIWLCDTFAYFIGTAYGKHKLAPKTSPKKSWEGAIAGFVGAIISFSLLDILFKLNLPITFQLLFGSIVGVIGQIGDLAESKIKREFNVKDSSNILPGHGGFLDRLDSIMFVYPATLLAITLPFLLG